jgi:uncharacterized RDD family membrane protein YckC
MSSAWLPVSGVSFMRAAHSFDDAAPGETPARLGARVIDVLILTAVGVGLGQAMGFGFDWLAVTATVVIVYFAGLDAAIGTTPGKLAFRLRVVGPDGNRPTPGQAVIREAFTLLGAIPFIGPVLAIAAWVWILLTVRKSPLRQGKHDLLAGGTRVIRVGN